MKTLIQLLAVGIFAYVIPVGRALDQIVKASAVRTPVSIVVVLEQPAPPGTTPPAPGTLAESVVQPTSAPADWPTEVRIDLHPQEGMRIDDGRGGRWVLKSGRVVAASSPELPVWVPQLEVLLFSSIETLTRQLNAAGVDTQRAELGRCGDADCLVIGGRQRRPQLWVDKDSFELRRWVPPLGRSFELAPYKAFDKIKFPARIEVLDEGTRLAILQVRSLTPAAKLGPADFSARWVKP